jgi:arylsulfatase
LSLVSQFHHVIDIAPTVLEACKLPEPKEVNGITQRPIEGVSMVYSFDDPTSKDRRTTQYFEISCNRAIYHDGWVAMTIHRIPWEFKPRATLQTDAWELYHVTEDFSESANLANKHPEKLKELQDLFLKEAVKYNVLPLDDRSVERFNAEIAGRPDLMGGRTKMALYSGAPGMMENAFINTKNRSHSITATVEIPEGGANGVILCQGGRFAGWSLYFKDGKPCYAYNWFGLETYKISADKPMVPGKVTIRYEFTFDGGKPGSGGTGAIFVNDTKVAEGKIAKTVASTISLDETADIGEDTGTVVTDDYKERHNKFTGKISKVTVELK